MFRMSIFLLMISYFLNLTFLCTNTAKMVNICFELNYNTQLIYTSS
jgi:hypothetical protein